MAARRLAAQHGCPGAGAGAYVVALACDDGASAPDCLVASVSEDAGGGGLLEVLDLPQLRPACAVRGPHAGAAAEDLCFLRGSPRCLASCGADGSALLWDLREGGGGQVRPARTLLAGGGDPAAAVALCPDGRLCACASGAAVRVLELGSGRELFAHEEAHSEPVSRLRFHPRRAGELLSAGDDGLLCALDCRRCEQGGKAVEEDAGLRLVMNTEEGVDRLGLVADDLAVACTVSTTGLLQLWSLGGPQPGALLARHDCLRGEPALRVGESDGYVLGTLYDEGSGVAHVAAGGVDGRLGLFHLNLEAASFSGLVPHGAGGGGHSGVVRSLAQLGASRRFATGGEDGLVCLWRPAGRRPASAAPAAAAGKRRRP